MDCSELPIVALVPGTGNHRQIDSKANKLGYKAGFQPILMGLGLDSRWIHPTACVGGRGDVPPTLFIVLVV